MTSIDKDRVTSAENEQVTDDQIYHLICEVLHSQDAIDASNVVVHVKDGQVTLTGDVSSQEEKLRVESLCDAVADVKTIHNRVRISSQKNAGKEGTHTERSAWAHGDARSNSRLRNAGVARAKP